MADEENGVRLTGVLPDGVQHRLGIALVDRSPVLDELGVRPAPRRLVPRLARPDCRRADDELRDDALSV